MAAGEGSFSDPPLPDPWVPGCIKAWDTAWCATSAGMEVALLMALAILRLCGTVKEPIVAPSVSGPPRDAACKLMSGRSFSLEQRLAAERNATLELIDVHFPAPGLDLH